MPVLRFWVRCNQAVHLPPLLRPKYMDLMANAIILQNVVDMTTILQQLQQEGFTVNQNTLAILGPYLTEHLRRFGHYVVEFDKLPPPLQLDVPLLPTI